VAGTDHGKTQETETGAQPVFVLVAPQMGENIGAAARAMWNFGLDAMRLVAPRDGWPNPKAEAMASGAGRVLDRARLTATTAEACADLTYVFATTARDRAMTKLVLTPEQAMAEARAMTATRPSRSPPRARSTSSFSIWVCRTRTV
jgi:tRNA/rRNA methyltransferase